MSLFSYLLLRFHFFSFLTIIHFYVGKSALDGASDDDGEANSYDYDDSFIDDSGASSSSFDDDADDSDYNPNDRHDGESDEDLTELVGNAQAFIGNKKMLK